MSSFPHKNEGGERGDARPSGAPSDEGAAVRLTDGASKIFSDGAPIGATRAWCVPEHGEGVGSVGFLRYG